MCGIVAITSTSGRSFNLESPLRAIKHRGPDDSGAFASESGDCHLGHVRLSIIDLSPAGHQPMLDLSGRYIISYNGVFLLILDHATKEHASYQFIAVIFILTAVLILGHQDSKIKRTLIYILSAVVLFLNGARTEFFSFCLLAMVLESLRIKNKRTLVVALISSFLGVYTIIQYIKHLLPDNRVIHLILASHEEGYMGRTETPQWAKQIEEDKTALFSL